MSMIWLANFWPSLSLSRYRFTVLNLGNNGNNWFLFAVEFNITVVLAGRLVLLNCKADKKSKNPSNTFKFLELR